MIENVVVSDTSVLINLARVEHEHLLPKLYRCIFAPPAVRSEFERLASTKQRFMGLQWPGWIILQTPDSTLDLVAGDHDLDRGEHEAIALALEIRADCLLVDEAAGRAAADHLHLKHTGILGILLKAKDCGYIPCIREPLEAIIKKGRFYLSDQLIAATLKQAGEL